MSGTFARGTAGDAYRVVVNAEAQYSVWPHTVPLPDGWEPVGVSGSREHCLAHIGEIWTDMRPASLRTAPAAGTAPAGPGGVGHWWHEPVRDARAVGGVSGAAGAEVPVPDAGIHELIDARNAAFPHEIAVRYGTLTVTRAELDRRTRVLALRLIARGARPERPVAVLLPRSADAVTAIVAVLRSGAAYLPLSLADPGARLAAILRDADEPLVVTDERGRALLGDYGGPVLLVDGEADLGGEAGLGGEVGPGGPAGPGGETEPAGEAEEDGRSVPGDLPRVSSANLAYIVYTSGTTGPPKGVLGTHGQLVNYVRWCAEEFALPSGEQALLHAPLYFVGSVMTLFTALVAGWELDVAPEPVAFDELARIAREGSCGFLKLTPSHVRALTALGEVADLARLVMIGSEPLHLTAAFADWIADSPSSRFANHYGMSETVGCTWYWVSGHEPAGERLPVGGPILNAEVHIVGEDGERLPHGEVGELCVAGDVIARGYHGRPALTAARWTPHPWGRPGERLLHTGDLARMTPDGTVEVLGRGDRQVKIRGHRVELPMVEDVLRRCPGVAEAVAAATPDAQGFPRLTAYLRPVPGVRPRTGEVRERVARELPEPSVPSRVVLVSGYPQTPNGKIDYARLAEAPVLRPESAGVYREPTTPAEKALCAVFSAVLQMERVGADDDFLDLGGDSLSVVQVVTAAEELGMVFTIGEFFDARTPTALAQRMRQKEVQEQGTAREQEHVSADGGAPPAQEEDSAPGMPSVVASLPVRPDGDAAQEPPGTSWLPVPFSARAGSGPMTWGQVHIWRPLRWFGGASAAFNLKRIVTLPAPGVALDDCLTALRRLIEAHQVLRTRFPEGSGTPRQVVVGSGAYLVEAHQVTEDASATASTDGAVGTAAGERAERLAGIPFRLGHEWPVRFSLICRGRRVHAIAVVASHVALDGWAVERLTATLTTLIGGDSAPSPAAPWQPLDQAAYERSERGRRQDARAMEYWRARLAELPDVPSGPRADATAGPPVQTWSLDSAALAAASVELARRTRTSSSVVLLTLAATALSAIRAQHTVALQLIAANRYTGQQQRLLASSAQDGLLVFHRADVPLDEAVRTVYRQATEGYFHAQYDPDSRASLLDEVARNRRHPVDLSGYFNDARLGRDWEVSGGLGTGAGQRPVFVRGFERHDMTFCLALAQHAHACRVSLLADTAYLPEDRIPALLSGLESLLLTALEREVRLDEVPEALGLPALPALPVLPAGLPRGTRPSPASGRPST